MDPELIIDVDIETYFLSFVVIVGKKRMVVLKCHYMTDV